jgi:hypothetical protein
LYFTRLVTRGRYNSGPINVTLKTNGATIFQSFPDVIAGHVTLANPAGFHRGFCPACPLIPQHLQAVEISGTINQVVAFRCIQLTGDFHSNHAERHLLRSPVVRRCASCRIVSIT